MSLPLRRCGLLLAGVALLAAPARAALLDEWHPVRSAQSGIKLDVDVVNVERHGNVRRAWVRALLDQAQLHEKTGKYIGAILIHERLDCGGRNVTVERVLFLSPDGEQLEEVKPSQRVAQPIAPGSSDESVARLVCSAG